MEKGRCHHLRNVNETSEYGGSRADSRYWGVIELEQITRPSEPGMVAEEALVSLIPLAGGKLQEQPQVSHLSCAKNLRGCPVVFHRTEEILAGWGLDP